MGTVNYATSDFVTLGIKPYDYMDFENDAEFMDDARKNIKEYGGTLEDEISSYIDELHSCDYENIEYELKKHHFHYFHIDIKPGYYEGFTLDIEFNYGLCFNSWEDKRDAQKEITEIKKFLKTCAGLGMVACSTGWRTTYSDYNSTLKEIDRAIKEMRKTVKETPTWNQYSVECA